MSRWKHFRRMTGVRIRSSALRELHRIEADAKETGLSESQARAYRHVCLKATELLLSDDPKRKRLVADVLLILVPEAPYSTNWSSGWDIERMRDKAVTVVESNELVPTWIRKMGERVLVGHRPNHTYYLRSAFLGTVKWWEPRDRPDDEIARREPERDPEGDSLVFAAAGWPVDERRARMQEELRLDRERWGERDASKRDRDHAVVEVFERRMQGETESKACAAMGITTASYQRRQPILRYAVLRSAEWLDFLTVFSAHFARKQQTDELGASPQTIKRALSAELKTAAENHLGDYRRLMANHVVSPLKEKQRGSQNGVAHYWTPPSAEQRSLILPTAFRSAVGQGLVNGRSAELRLHLVTVRDGRRVRDIERREPAELAEPMRLDVRYQLGHPSEAAS